ncbi:phosphoribosylpyrophosphate synthetase [Rhodobacterales bacterium 52_120_T64]|nr:phosphoribosylpyrophosphate synthetase [Rhodobacterales bacterium 52_120_T64]
MKPVVFAFPDNEDIAQDLVAHLGAELGEMNVHRFPDGETVTRILTPVAGRKVILVCTLDRPDEKFLPLIFAAATLRDLGALEVGLIAPYLCYLRQDERFRDGEGITARYFAKALGQWIDWILTVDPHLHRINSLSDIYRVPSAVVHAAPAISGWIRENVSNPLVIGPDNESKQWVAAVADKAGAPYLVLEKTRFGDREVAISMPENISGSNYTPVLVDDIISTGKTMIKTVENLVTQGTPPPICIGIHAIFAETAYQDFQITGVTKLITTNSIQHPSNVIDLSTLIANSVKHLLKS